MFAGGCRGDGVGQPRGPMGLANLVVPAGAYATRRAAAGGILMEGVAGDRCALCGSLCVHAGRISSTRCWESKTSPGGRALSSQGAHQASEYHRNGSSTTVLRDLKNPNA